MQWHAELSFKYVPFTRACLKLKIVYSVLFFFKSTVVCYKDLRKGRINIVKSKLIQLY